ncbi:MAG: hypothetical protein Q8Q06_00985 [bacterium]|nr:hypothetical protein [bacterium]
MIDKPQVGQDYSIEEIQKDILYMLIVNVGRLNWAHQNQACFLEGLKEIAKKYKICKIVTLQSNYSYANPTSALCVFVEPK